MANHKLKIQAIKDIAARYTAATRQGDIEKALIQAHGDVYDKLDSRAKQELYQGKIEPIRQRYAADLKQAQAELQHEVRITKDELRLKKQRKESGFDLIQRYATDHKMSVELAKSILDDQAAKNKGVFDPDDYTDTYIALKKHGTPQASTIREVSYAIDNIYTKYMKEAGIDQIEQELKGSTVYLQSTNLDDVVRTCAYMGLMDKPAS